jgi:hypothetical protein
VAVFLCSPGYSKSRNVEDEFSFSTDMIVDWLDGRRDFTGGRCDSHPRVPRQRTGRAGQFRYLLQFKIPRKNCDK